MAVGSPSVTSVSPHSHSKLPYRFTFLLITELAVILCFPFTSGEGERAHLFRVLAILLIAAGLYTIIGRGKLTAVAFLLGLPPLVIHLINVSGHLMHLVAAAMALGVVYLAFMTAIFVRAVLAEPTVTRDTLAGAISAYLLIGITYGVLYGLIEQVAPGSFRETISSGRPLHPPDLIFFSFTSLTTVGYGDIVPWSGISRSLAVLESITGVMYPAVLIGRLIGLRGTQRNPP